MEIGFPEALAALGALLVAASAASGLSGRTVLSVSILAVAAGAGMEALGVLTVEPTAHAIIVVVELVLLVTLFSDGMLVEQELLRRVWRGPVRALTVALPINAALLALAAMVLLPDITWAEAFLLGFLLSPTDPVLTSSVVASDHVPPAVRHILNVESGLNDGLALPFVLFFLALSTDSATGLVATAGDLALESVVGVAVGAALAAAAGGLLHALPDWAITRRYEGLYALGLGLAAYGVADLLQGNGLIAAFCAGVAFALVRTEAPGVFHRFNEDLGGVLQLIAFAIFGALVVETGFDLPFAEIIAFAVFALVVARPASVLLAMLGTPLRRPERLFVAWFGPKGIASMLFALFVLNSTAPDRTIVFDTAAATILASVVAHGLTDTVGARWIGERLEEAERDAPAEAVRRTA
jgi:NhaP-type Na+/H+ or K+/H+ antiporter